MTQFIGRDKELTLLDEQLARARSGDGALVWIDGRRRMGKSRLVQEFLDRSQMPHVFFQASVRGNSLEPFVDAIAQSTLPAARAVREGLRPTTWRAALELVASGATPDAPCVIVLDEYPYLNAVDPAIDADLQAVWDRVLERACVMLVCIGSDQAMMERLLEHDRPLHGRPTSQIRVGGLTPFEIGELLNVEPDAALDAYLVVGGYPAVAREWRAGATRTSFLKQALRSPSTPLITNGERILSAELPGEQNARDVLEVIGLGERTFTAIGKRSGVPRATLERALATLTEKRLIERRTPLSIPASTTESRYQVIDAGLRFWLRFIGPYLAELERGRSDLLVQRIADSWSDFRGTSIEPVVREALTRLLPDAALGDAQHVGGYWTRSNDPEIDLVGVDAVPRPRSISFVGSIKWRDRTPFDDADAGRLISHRTQLPGATDDMLLVGVSRTGFETNRLDVHYGPAAIVNAFAPRAGN